MCSSAQWDHHCFAWTLAHYCIVRKLSPGREPREIRGHQSRRMTCWAIWDREGLEALNMLRGCFSYFGSVTNYSKTQWLKTAKNSYYFSRFIWVRNLYRSQQEWLISALYNLGPQSKDSKPGSWNHVKAHSLTQWQLTLACNCRFYFSSLGFSMWSELSYNMVDESWDLPLKDRDRDRNSQAEVAASSNLESQAASLSVCSINWGS